MITEKSDFDFTAFFKLITISIQVQKYIQKVDLKKSIMYVQG